MVSIDHKCGALSYNILNMKSTTVRTLTLLPLVMAVEVLSLRGGSSSSSDANEYVHRPQHEGYDSPFPGMIGSDFLGMNQNIANIWEPFQKDHETAVFFTIPNSRTADLEAYVSTCLGMVTANHIGQDYVSNKLEVVSVQDRSYINVNTMEMEGLAHASKLGLGSESVVDLIVSPHLHQVADQVFNHDRKGRLFTIMRDPVERVISLYQYLRGADMKDTYNPSLQHMTLAEFAVNKDFYLDNFMTRHLVGKASIEVPLSNQDVEHAKAVLSHKVLVGLSSQYKESVNRFTSYFGWDSNETCFDGLFREEIGTSQLANSEQDSAEIDLIAQANKFDMLLYDFAVRLFEQQALLLEH